jgi:D-beta-D-heptose 7-phosphate kinase / D-beta-D-heptose 1-phosphate adenosyltransferase
MINFDKFAAIASAITVLSVGDIVVDEFAYGEIRSRFGPPVLVTQAARVTLGGAAGIALASAAFGARCSVVAAVGDDCRAELLRQPIKSDRISFGLLNDPDRSTLRRTRFVGDHAASPLLCAEWDRGEPVHAQIEEGLLARILGEVLVSDIVVLSDYCGGAMSDRLVKDTIAAARQQGIPTLVISTHSDFSRYAGATILAPEFEGFCAVNGREPGSVEELERDALRLLERSSLEALLVLRPGQGLSFIPRATAATHLDDPELGGGDRRCNDAGIAALALALASGHSWVEAMAVCYAAAISPGSEGSGLLEELRAAFTLPAKAGRLAVVRSEND